MTRDEGAKRSQAKWKSLSKNTLKEKDLKVVVNLRMTEGLMKKEVRLRRQSKSSKKWRWLKNVDLEGRKIKRKSIRDIHLDYHLQAHLLMILMGVNIEAMRERKAQIQDLGWFLRISTNTTYLLMSQNRLRLILIISSKGKP